MQAPGSTISSSMVGRARALRARQRRGAITMSSVCTLNVVLPVIVSLSECPRTALLGQPLLAFRAFSFAAVMIHSARLNSSKPVQQCSAVQGVCSAIGSDTARSARDAKEHAAAQIGGYLNHSGGSSSSRLSGCGGSSRSSAPATACNVRRNTALKGSSATSVVLATKAGFVVIIPSKMAC